MHLGQVPPDRPEDVWEPVRAEVTDPASAFSTYLLAYEGPDALGGVALVGHDALSVMLNRCYVRPHCRRQGVARVLVAATEDEAARRGAARLVVDIIASRRDGITAWQYIGFIECQPWGDTSMRCFERRLPWREPSAWLEMVARADRGLHRRIGGHLGPRRRRSLRAHPEPAEQATRAAGRAVQGRPQEHRGVGHHERVGSTQLRRLGCGARSVRAR